MAAYDEGLVSSPVPDQAPEARMRKEQGVEEVLTRLRRGEAVVGLARQYGVDPKTIRAWRARGRYRERAPRAEPSVLDPYAAWLRDRAPEVEYNAAVLHRELVQPGFTGSPAIVRRFVRPLRLTERAGLSATVRFETEPGQQAYAGAGRFWPAARVDRRRLSAGTPVRLHAGLLAAAIPDGVSPRAAGRRHTPCSPGTSKPSSILAASRSKSCWITRGLRWCTTGRIARPGATTWCGTRPMPTSPPTTASGRGPTGPTGPRRRGRPNPA